MLHIKGKDDSVFGAGRGYWIHLMLPYSLKSITFGFSLQAVPSLVLSKAFNSLLFVAQGFSLALSRPKGLRYVP